MVKAVVVLPVYMGVVPMVIPQPRVKTFWVVGTRNFQNLLRRSADWKKTEGHQETSVFVGALTWNMVDVPGSGMEVMVAIETILTPKRPVMKFVLILLEKR